MIDINLFLKFRLLSESENLQQQQQQQQLQQQQSQQQQQQSDMVLNLKQHLKQTIQTKPTNASANNSNNNNKNNWPSLNKSPELKSTSSSPFPTNMSQVLGSLGGSTNSNMGTAPTGTNPFLATSNLMNLLAPLQQQQQQQQQNQAAQQQHQLSSLLNSNPLLATAAVQSSVNNNNNSSNDMSKMLENLINCSNYFKMMGNGFSTNAVAPSSTVPNFANNMAAAAAAAAVASNSIPNSIRASLGLTPGQTITSEQQAILSKLSALSNVAL